MSETRRMTVAIRAAEMADAEMLASLMCELGYETRRSEMEMRLEGILPDERYRTFVAVSNGRICGMIGTFCYHSYEHNSVGARILALVVSQNARGRKIGRALVQAAETDLAERNILRLTVDTHVRRADAHRFYESFGYEKNGFRYLKTLPAQMD